MGKNKKIIAFLFSVILCISLLSLPALAAEETGCIDGSILTHEKEARDMEFFGSLSEESGISMYGTYLASGVSYIKNEGNGVVYIGADTDCYSTCSAVSVTLYLQRLVNGSWQTISSRSHTSHNTFFLSYGLPLAVKTGYYYRVTASHSVTHNGVTESTTTTTNGIYVG